MHAGNPVSSMSPTTNIVYAGRLEQTHDLSGATLIPLILSFLYMILAKGWSTLKMNLRVKL